MGLTAYAYPLMALLHKVIQKNQAMPLPDHRHSPRLARDALVLGPSAALNRDPTFNFQYQELFSNSHTSMCSTANLNISTSTPGV